MPEMTPMGNQVIPPDPQKGIGLMSSILGVQQQRQNLQTGQIQQATAQAESTQKQQQSNELQAAQTLAKNGTQSGAYTNPDGSFNRQRMADDISKVAPTYGQSISNQLLSGANEVVNNKRALQGLNQDQQTQFSGVLTSLATKKDLTNTDIIDAFSDAADINPSPEFRRMLMSGLTHIPANASSQQLQQLIQQVSSMTSGQQQQTPSSIDTGAAVQPGTTNRYSGGFTPAGASIAKQLGPSITQTPGGQLARVGGNGSTLTPLQTAQGDPGASPPDLNQTTAQVETGRGLARGVTDRVSQALGQANNTIQAQDALNRARAILESPESPNTGAAFENTKNLKNVMSSLGIDTQGADNMNSLAKNLARFEGARASAAGLGGTDAARELAHNGSPNTTVDNKALLGIVRQSLAAEKVLAGYAKIQSQSTDPQALIKNESAFRNIQHPIETIEYTMSRNKGEAEQYLKEHGLTHADIAKSAAQLKQFGIL